MTVFLARSYYISGNAVPTATWYSHLFPTHQDYVDQDGPHGAATIDGFKNCNRRTHLGTLYPGKSSLTRMGVNGAKQLLVGLRQPPPPT